MEAIIISLFSIIIALLINQAAIPIIIKNAHKNKWYDLPDHRKIHTGLIPRLGGVGIFIAFLSSSLIVSLTYFVTRNTFIGILDIKYISIFLAFGLIYAIGILDDFISQKAIVKLLFQLVAAGIIMAGGFVIKNITLPYIGEISLGVFGYFVTLFWIIGVTNAVNLIDGMDGLAGGIGAFAAFSMGIISLIQGQVSAAVTSFALFGAIAGFLIYNLPPAKIFMGDSGSLFLGFSLAVIPFMGISKAASFGTVIIPITLLIIPIIDVLAAIIRRVKEKRGIMSPDRGHIHHKLLDMGFSEKKILVLIYSVCFYLSVIAVTSVIMPRESNVFVIFVVWVGSMLGYGLIHYLNTRSNADQTSKEDSRDQNSA